jgi:SAM-dependent methyltransferase
MKTNGDRKQQVMEHYDRIATATDGEGCCSPAGGTSCCGGGEQVVSIRPLEDRYAGTAGYVPEADLGLGCGIPTRHAAIAPGDVVLDLGSGAGNDAFIVSHEVGPEGRVIGVDFTPSMVERARENARKRGVTNVEFLSGDIEELPIADNTADVTVSNCVLNLVPDKRRAFAEIFRTLKPGGHFCVSDIVATAELPEPVRRSAALYAGCIAGALERKEYLRIVAETGFSDITIHEEKAVSIPQDDLDAALERDPTKGRNLPSPLLVSMTLSGRKAR